MASGKLGLEDKGNFISVTSGDENLLNLGKKESFASGTCDIQIKQKRGSIKLTEEDKQLERKELEVEESSGKIKLESEDIKAVLELKDGDFCFKIEAEESDFIEFSVPARTDEKFFGMGEQFTGPELSGEKVPVVVQEQGIGRGKPMVSKAIEMISEGASGHSTSTYFPLPRYISSRNYGLQLESKGISQFEFSSERVVITCYEDSVEGRIFFGNSGKDILRKFGERYGTMDRPPGWISSGSVLGLQGGNEEVFSNLDRLRRADAPISAVWIQDWEGQRSTLAGKQLWWDWSVDHKRYSDWERFVGQLERENINLLGYINPYLVKRDRDCLFDVAKDRDFLLKDSEDDIIFEKVAGFKAAMIDLSRDEAVEWIEKIIEKKLVENGFDGWMADFGESLPFDSEPANIDAESFHNRYAEKWIEINSKVAEKNDCFFFCRTGFTDSVKKSQMIWCGDQLTTWDSYDGLKSALDGILNAGMSGITVIHSDTGGYHSFKKIGVGISRGEELLKRWTEMNTFTSMLRTHEGNQPSSNAQVYDENVSDHFARFAKIFQLLSSYRKKLFIEAEKDNLPVVRHMGLEFEEENLWDIGDQFMFGSEFLVAPVMEKNTEGRDVYLPEGDWVYLWNNEKYSSDGEKMSFIAPVGEPPVFFREGSEEGLKLLNKLEDQGLM